MKTIEMSKAVESLADYARRIGDETVIVVRKGKPVAALVSAKGMDAESIALANNPTFVSIIERSRARHEAEGGLTSNELRRRLGLPPKRRSKKR